MFTSDIYLPTTSVVKNWNEVQVPSKPRYSQGHQFDIVRAYQAPSNKREEISLDIQDISQKILGQQAEHQVMGFLTHHEDNHFINLDADSILSSPNFTPLYPIEERTTDFHLSTQEIGRNFFVFSSIQTEGPVVNHLENPLTAEGLLPLYHLHLSTSRKS